MPETLRPAAGGPRARKPEDPEAYARERREALRDHARVCEEHLGKPQRLAEGDRRILVRNFGRLLERRFPKDKRAIATGVFRRAFGKDGGPSMDKKRKRFMRFEGEPLPSGAPSGEYNASGKTFLALIRAFAEECGERPDSETGWRMLTSLCRGASFAGGPTLASRGDPRERFRDCMTGMLDRLARDPYVIAYLRQIRQFPIRSHPDVRGIDFRPPSEEILTPQQFEELAYRRWLPQRFEHVPSADPSSHRVLDGFGWDEPPDLLPQIRLARIYWPRSVLCLPIGVETAALEAVDAIEPAPEDLEALLARMSTPDREYALWLWRDERKQALLEKVMRENGLDPDQPDWTRFVDPLTDEALEGATWQRCYQARSYDLVLAAEGEPANLRLGIHTSGYWRYRPNTQRMPEDNAPELDLDGSDSSTFGVFPVDGMSMICRRLALLDENGYFDMDEYYHPMIAAMVYETFDLEHDKAWRLLSMPMIDGSQARPDEGGRFRNDEEPPCLRPCFQAPEGWAPAPEGSLAAAMMRSLAHGRGPERLDTLLAEAIKARVACLSEMQEELEQRFRKGLRDSGYGP
jgi:hypothetical protein